MIPNNNRGWDITRQQMLGVLNDFRRFPFLLGMIDDLGY
jgi:hypothetical protein